MRFLYARTSLIVLLLAAAAATARPDERLAPVYAAILRGDYDAGRSELARLRAEGAPATEAAQVENWLDAFRQSTSTRAELKAATFAWNVEHAQQALADGQIYLALTFADRAAAYAPDRDAYGAEPWITDLAAKARAEAQRLESEQRWPRVFAYYTVLSRIYPKDKVLEEAREDAGRRARLYLLYKDQAALERRIKDVSKDLLQRAVRLINESYYQEPDFKRMAEGALNNLISLSKTQKMYDFLDGLGNPATREHFTRALEELLASVKKEEHYDHKDLLKLFRRVALVNTESVELPEGLLVTEFLEGAVQQIDQFTAMVWPADANDFDKVMMGGFEGVGIQLGLDEHTNRLKVVTPLEDSPALEAGIQPGDLIIEVDGKTTKGWSTEDAVNNIMGPKGTEVVLTIFRPGTDERIPFKLTRRKIVIKTVRGLERLPDDPQRWNYMLDKEAGVAYIKLSGFHPESHDELVQALQAAEQQGMRGLILDVRRNPGGMLDVAVRVVSLFLREGEVVSTGGRQEPHSSLPAAKDPAATDVPLVVLVDDSSASASEILAGALRDHHRAIVLGERTYGKGSVQRVIPLDRQARLKLTTALYYLPSGHPVQHKGLDSETWGVDPDREVKLTPKELRQVLKRETETSIIHNEAQTKPAPDDADRAKQLDELKAEEEKDDEPPLLTDAQIKELESDPTQAPEADAQLETALLLLRAKLAANLPWPQQLAAKTNQSKP